MIASFFASIRRIMIINVYQKHARQFFIAHMEISIAFEQLSKYYI